MHREGDIRRQAAALMGEIIARFHAGYAKERPAGWTPDPRSVTDMDQWRLYLDRIIYPDRKLMVQHRRWVSFTLKMVVNSLLRACEQARREDFLREFLRFYRRPERLEDETAFQLLETATALPMEELGDRQRYDLLLFAQALAGREDATVRLAAVLLMDYLRPAIATQDVILHALRDVSCAGERTLSLLRDQLVAEMGDPDRTVAEQLEAGNALLAQATMGKTRLASIENGSEHHRREAREAGFSCLEADLDRSDSGLRDSAQAENLLRQVSAQRGDVRIWLGDRAGAAGLRAFLAAAQAENRCLALTETLA